MRRYPSYMDRLDYYRLLLPPLKLQAKYDWY